MALTSGSVLSIFSVQLLRLSPALNSRGGTSSDSLWDSVGNVRFDGDRHFHFRRNESDSQDEPYFDRAVDIEGQLGAIGSDHPWSRIESL